MKLIEHNTDLVNPDCDTEIAQVVVNNSGTYVDDLRINTAETFASGAPISSDDIENEADQEEQIIRRFLETMRDGVNTECIRCGDCNKCSCAWPDALCDFRHLWDVGIDAVMSKYEDFRKQENVE